MSYVRMFPALVPKDSLALLGRSGETMPMLRILSNEQLKKLHESALFVLERVGVRATDDSTLRIFRDHGAVIDEKARCAKLPPALVEEALKKTPKNPTLGARTREYAVTLQTGRMYTRASTGLTEVIDHDTGLSRHGLSSDTVEALALVI